MPTASNLSRKFDCFGGKYVKLVDQFTVACGLWYPQRNKYVQLESFLHFFGLYSYMRYHPPSLGLSAVRASV